MPLWQERISARRCRRCVTAEQGCPGRAAGPALTSGPCGAFGRVRSVRACLGFSATYWQCDCDVLCRWHSGDVQCCLLLLQAGTTACLAQRGLGWHLHPRSLGTAVSGSPSSASSLRLPPAESSSKTRAAQVRGGTVPWLVLGLR